MTGAVAADGLKEAACLIPVALARGGNRRAPIGWPPRSAYLHIPFCHRRCFYCDFPVVPLGDRAAADPGAKDHAKDHAFGGCMAIGSFRESETISIVCNPYLSCSPFC